MRRSRRVSKAHQLAENPAGICDLDAAASQATYLGSVEHKTYQSPAGDPRPRRDASKCPRIPDARWDELTEALRAAVRSGCISDSIDPGGLPRYVWGLFEGFFYEARHLSSPANSYKAYPVEECDLPDGALQRIMDEVEASG